MLDEVVRSEEVGGASAHDEGPTVDVDHDGTLLVVSLGSVDVEVEAVLVADGRCATDIVLRADVAVVGGVELGGEWRGVNWRLKFLYAFKTGRIKNLSFSLS
jgi:hypothetical protein